VAESACCNDVDTAVVAAGKIGYPVLVRAAFALGGLGSGFAHNEQELVALVNKALVNSPQVIIDKSLKGWKEVEYEVVRDGKDNCITVCNMENFDPMGIHTGDSIVVAPSQTLSNEEYFMLRSCAIKFIRQLGVKGECNIQYALDPNSSEFRIIEVNARLSRSSALASKATGYPLAYVAAKIALGHDLVMLRNLVTKSTTACFEPALDYCVVKIPRWDLKKFHSVDPEVGSCMKSVGEIMAIGRGFEEAIQKGLRMVDESCNGFDPDRWDMEFQFKDKSLNNLDSVEQELSRATPARAWAIAKAYQMGLTVERIRELTNIDVWFLAKLLNIHNMTEKLQQTSFFDLEPDAALLEKAKTLGFSDRQIAQKLMAASNATPVPRPLNRRSNVGYTGGPVTEKHVQQLRWEHRIHPIVKQIDTLAAEFPAATNYLYLTYNGTEHDVKPTCEELQSGPKRDHKASFDYRPKIRNFAESPALKPKDTSTRLATVPTGADRRRGGAPGAVIVLGCGSYRIGSSVEFDWCCVQALKTVRSLGGKGIVINCNPETVSTDFDESDRLYFDELSEEVVTEISKFERPDGMVISVGGQTPNNLAIGLTNQGVVNILGTSVSSIDMAENRFKFSRLCDKLMIDQPEWAEFTTFEEALDFCARTEFPSLVRPSYVLSGAAMRVVTDPHDLENFLRRAAVVSRDYPVVISKYIMGAKEVEFDAVGSSGEVVNYAISEHVENAGCHSGDATLLLPAQRLYVETHRRIKRIAQKLCKALNITGPFNIQFLCKENEVKVIECNLRASRTFPFISKTFNVNFIEIATRAMLNLPVRAENIHPIDIEFVGCKAAMFSFNRLKNSDPRLGVEMQSTGEVACYGTTQYEAFLKALMSTGFKLPDKSIYLCIGPFEQKLEFVSAAKSLVEMGYKLFGSKNTAEFMKERGVSEVATLFKPFVKREPNVKSYLTQGKIDLVICIPSSMDSMAATDGFEIRRGAIDSGTMLLTNIKQATLLVEALVRKEQREKQGKQFWGITSWHEYHMID